MAIATVPYDVRIDHDGRKYDVHIDTLSVPQCTNCGAISIDSDASEQIDRAFRRAAELLSPQEIRERRIAAGFHHQQDFARVLGVSPSTLNRWENGAQVQQRFHDRMLRAFFDVPEFRAYLASHQVTATMSTTTMPRVREVGNEAIPEHAG
jgi:DNA-binding transcriptional regulator YiaG